MRIRLAEAALLVVDFQERLAAAMATEPRAAAGRDVVILLELARRRGMPVVVSEQYPKGLGATVPALAGALAAFGGRAHRLEKLTFSCTEAPGFEAIFAAVGRRQWIVAGMEAHVCV